MTAASLRRPRAAFVVGLLGLTVPLTSCSLQDEGHRWSDQLAPAGVCWEVNLLDGMAGPAELRQAFSCVNQSGSLDPLRPVVDATELSARDGQRNWDHLVALTTAGPLQDLDLLGLLNTATDLLETDPDLTLEALDAATELLYAQPVPRLDASSLASPEALQAGVLVPLVAPLQEAAVATLDDGSAIPTLLADALRSQSLRDALCTLVGVARSADPTIAPIADDAMAALGEAISLSRSPGNDRWRNATGDSLRDLVDTLLYATDTDGALWTHAGEPSLRRMLADTALRDRLEVTVLRLAQGGHLSPLFQQLRVLAEVDSEGTSLDAPASPALPGSRISALSSFLRLIDSGRGTISCLGFELDNLSATLLRFLATLDPSTVELGVSLLGPFLDSWLGGLSLGALEFVCDGVDDELVWDLQSVDRFNDEETGNLLVILLWVLADAAPADGEDRVDELVDLLALAWRADLAPPVEELLRDLGNTDLADSVAATLPLVVDPSPLAVAECPTGSTPLDFDGLWGIAEQVLVPVEGQPSALDTLRPAAEPLLTADDTWVAVGNLAPLLGDDGAVLRDFPELGTRLLAADPELTAADALADLVGDPALREPTLQLLASPTLADALVTTAVDRPGPLPFAVSLHLDGTLARTLHSAELVLGWASTLNSSP